MYWDSPITVQLDAQIPRLVAHNSEPSMFAPIGAPAASLAAFTQPYIPLSIHSVMRSSIRKRKSYTWQVRCMLGACNTTVSSYNSLAADILKSKIVMEHA